MTNRRTFLMQGSAIGAAAMSLAQAEQARSAGVLDTVVVGLIGCGGRGTSLAKDFAKLEGVELSFVCDPDEARAEAAAKTVTSLSRKAPKVVKDLRQVLDDKSIDA